MPVFTPASTVNLPAGGPGNRYARTLLEQLGATVIGPATNDDNHPARRWADSGLMALTGNRDGPPQVCPVPLPDCADGALDAFRALAAVEVLPAVEGSRLLAERAAITGYQRNGARSLAGHCRLLASRDGRIGLSLTRADDWQLLPALFGGEDAPDWPSVEALAATRTSSELIEQGRLLGLAVVDAMPIPSGQNSWLDVTRCSGANPQRRREQPRVLDLSSLWAGPLCSHLWQAAGATVIKVEGSRRPDGARAGSAEFFELLNQGKQSIGLDLHTSAGQSELRALMQEADIVVEGSRPRALRQMGIIAEEVISAHPGLSWVSISGYGRREPQANWIAFGDDAGVAAGLSAILHQVTGQWLICGDAIADPLTGMHAALAGWAGWLAGGGQLIELSLEQTVRHCITATAPADDNYRDRHRQWLKYLQDQRIKARPPRRRGGE